MDALLREVRGCQVCAGLPLGPRPILQAGTAARLLIAGQAPGRITHAKGVPFDDPSGDRLRAWLGIDRAAFYDASRVALVPMGFCFPGAGKGGDAPPRPECAALWRGRVLAALRAVELTIVIGRYAIDWHLPGARGLSVAEAVRAAGADVVVLPHPSPRNNRWLRQNPWFEAGILPPLRERVASVMT